MNPSWWMWTEALGLAMRVIPLEPGHVINVGGMLVQWGAQVAQDIWDVMHYKEP